MKYLFILAVAASATTILAGDTKRPQPQPQVAETVQQIMQLRQQVMDFYSNPNPEAATTIRSRWQEIPAEVRNRIEGRHPGTGMRILDLNSEIPAPVPDTTTKDVPATGTNTPAVASHDIWGQPVNAVPPPAIVPQPNDPWARPASTVTRPSTPPPLYFADDLDIFGNRPKPAHKR